MPEMQLMLAQAFKATDFSYPDVEGVIANSRWEEELLLPCMASVRTASASSAAAGWHTRQPHPVSKQGSANSTGTQTASGRGRASVAVPDAREPAQRPGSPLVAMQKPIEQAAAPATPAGQPKDIPWAQHAIPQQPPRCLSPVPYQLLEPELGREPSLGTRPD